MGLFDSVMSTIATEIMNQNEKPPSKTEVNSLQSIINGIVNNNWTLTDDFEFYFFNTKFDISKFITDKNALDIFAEHTMSCEVPVLSSGEHDVVSGGERRMTTKMAELFRFNAKFRDSNGTALRRYFMKIWMAQQFEYFDDIKSDIVIMNNGVPLFYSPNVLITSISPIQFSHDSTQIAEFDVAFMSNTYADVDVSNFGKTTYVDNFRRTNSLRNAAEKFDDLSSDYFNTDDNFDYGDSY